MNFRTSVAVALAALLGIAVGVSVLLVTRGTHEFVGTVYTNPDPAPLFRLTADTGEAGELEDYELPQERIEHALEAIPKV